MKDNFNHSLPTSNVQNARFVKRIVVFFVFFFSMLFFSEGMVGQNLSEPNFEFLENFPLGIGGLGREASIVISVDTDSNGNIYVLTFGNGVFKYNPSTEEFVNIIPDVIGEDGELNAPLDLAIDNYDIIHIADSGSKKIMKFTTDGDALAYIGGIFGSGENEFFEPTGIEFDNDNNLYIVDSYRGSDDISDRYLLKVYYSNGEYGSFTGTDLHPLNNPYRVAANNNYIFISHGGNNGEVLVFNKDFSYNSTLDDIGSPGSLFIDKSNFIYAVDYSDLVDLNEVFTLIRGEISLATFQLYGSITNGIDEGEFKIQVYNPNLSHNSTLNDFPSNSNEDRIQFPLDITLDRSCGKLYLNDANIPSIGTLNFDLEIYKRTPSFDSTVPPISCQDDIEITANEGENYAVVNFQNATTTEGDVTITQTEGLSSGDQFPIGNSTIEFTATDLCGNKSTCTFTITVLPADNIPDTLPPVAFDDGTYNTDQNVTLSIPARGVLANDTDADSDILTAIIRIQPANGSVTLNSDGSFIYTPNTNYTGPDSFTYVANDGTIDSNVATVSINVNSVTPPNTAPVAFDDGIYNTDQNVTLSIPARGILANDTDADNDILTAIIRIQPANGSVTLNSDGSFIYTPNTNYTGPDSFTYVANDGTINSNVATVTIYTTPAAPTFDCPDPNVVTILPLDENCNFDEPDYSNKITNPKYFIEEAFFVQTSSRTDNTLNIQIEVYDGQGGEYIGKCEFPVTLQDQIPADVKCLEDKLITYTDSKSFRLEDYREQLTISDNCSSNFEIVQTPAPGTIITDNTTVNFRVTDDNNNQSDCSFNIKFFKESDLQILNCPGDQFFQVDENCSYAIPDIASTISTNIEGATVTQNITAGFSVNNDLTLVITAKFEDQVDTCEVKLITTDAIFPTIECPADQTERVQQGEGFQLPNYILNAVYDDNCFIQELKQQPDVGTVIYETTEIILTVVDNYGNSTECTFNVNIITENPDLQITCLEDQTANLDINCQFQLPDYTQQAQANFDAAITQSPLPGSLISSGAEITLTATGDSGQTSCSFNIDVVDTTPPVVNCVGIINLRLNAGGTASLSPQDLDDNSFDACGSILRTLSKSDFSVEDPGTNTVRLTVTDASGNSGFCDTTVNVLPYEENAIDFTCKESFILQLDENGEAQLSSEDLYTGTAGNYQFSVDKTSFTCADKGSNTVTLYYSDGNTGGNCRVEVVVEDLLPPVVRTKDISITLDANGTASITPEMLDDGSIDNCGDIRLFLDKTDFTCSDLGENSVILRAQDGSSNSASATATVTVLGNCQEPPVTPTGPGYIFIYPNPTDGPFSYYLPAGIVLEKVEVYDMQGKYITTTLFEEGTVQYKMNLSYLQSAVYVLKLYTNKKELILRVIVR